jgi:indolepyruvate ferredoxin oxidoreductase beta subunit
VLGAAASHLPFPAEVIEHQLQRLFGRKGERIVKANINAFRMGDAASRFAAALLAAGVASPVLARVLPRIAFEPHAVPEPFVAAWCQRLLREDSAELAQRLFDANEALAPDAVPA